MHEEWKGITGYEGWYEVSTYGRVRRIRGGQGAVEGKILSAKENNRGYRCVQLYKDGQDKRIKVHKLVMETFVGRTPGGMEINHKDTKRENNMLSNLEFVTHPQNTKHAIVMGRKPGKLSIEDVVSIKRLLANGELTQKQIATMYNVCCHTIHFIRNGQRWGWVREDEDASTAYLSEHECEPITRNRYVSRVEKRQLQKHINSIREMQTVKFLSGRGDAPHGADADGEPAQPAKRPQRPAPRPEVDENLIPF